MVNREFGSSNYEAPKTESDSSDTENKSTKKKKSYEAPAATGEKDKTSKDIGRSIFSAERPERAEAKGTDSPEVTNSESGVETIDSQESQYIASEIARDHLQSIEQAEGSVKDELAEAHVPELLERISEGEDPEAAFAEVAAEAGMTEDEIAEALAEAPEDAEESPESDDSETVEVIDTDATTEGEIDLDPTAPASPSPTVPAPTPAPAPGGGGSGAGSGPGPGFGSGAGGGGPRPSGRGSRGGGSTTNVSQIHGLVHNLPPAVNSHYEQRAKAGQLLVVGLVGYLIGRRHGRIKAEKRLLPVQKKLEKQVNKLEQDITRKEQLLVAAKKRSEQTPATNRQENRQFVAAERTQPSRVETRLKVEKPARAEQLGHMIVAAESPKASRTSSIREAFDADYIKTMSRAELLEVSDKIIVEGASLRRIYESNLVGEKQLRHLVSEHLRGHDIRKDLRREMVEHEIDFERDPIMRDRIRSRLNSGSSGGLNEMLASVGITNDDEDPELARRVRQEEARAEKIKHRREQRQQIIADSAMATAVVVLAVVVLILALRS